MQNLIVFKNKLERTLRQLFICLRPTPFLVFCHWMVKLLWRFFIKVTVLQYTVYTVSGMLVLNHMELDLPSLFGLHVYSCTRCLRLRTPPQMGSYTRALLVSQDRRHLFVPPCIEPMTVATLAVTVRRSNQLG